MVVNGESPAGSKSKRPLKLSLRKKALFALITVAFLLLSTEAVLWLVGYDSPVADPYESFVLKHPLFVSKGGVLTTAWPRQNFFHAQSFARSKPANTRRVFVFGGSTTYGYTLPNPRLDSYVNQLGRLLDDEFPGTRFDMINCGGLSYASYRLTDLVEECVNYSPDLVIVMSGHNEFIEARHYADLKGATSTTDRLWYSLRTVRLIQHLSNRYSVRQPVLHDNPFATEHYVVRDEREHKATLDHYARNLNRMVDACKKHNTPIILCTCPSNLLDHAPFHTVTPGNMELEEFDRLVRKAIKLFESGKTDSGKTDEALAIAQKILKDDPRAAICHYIAGKCFYRMKRMEEAKKSLILAKETDAFPHRSLNSFNDCVRSIARQRDTGLFDAEAQFSSESEHGIPGANLFVDDCHPTVDGHRLFAIGLKEISAKIIRHHNAPER